MPSSMLEAPPTQMLRSADDIRRWVVSEISKAMNVESSTIDTAAPLDTLGVDSLAAIGMTGGLSGWLNRDLPATLMWDYTSIDALAEGLADPEPIAHPGIVDFQPLGSNRPIFFFPGVGGHPVSFARLATALGTSQPCYGLVAPGLKENEKPITTVKEIAAVMVSNLRNVQPIGPYQLAGYSFGGFLACEAAQQLTAAGQTVSLLAIYDTYTHNGLIVRPLWQRLFVHVYLLMTRKNRLEYFHDRLKRLAPAQPPLKHEEPRAHDPLAQLVHRTHSRAFAQYHPQCYPGPIVLFRATERYPQEVFYKRDPSGGWSSLTSNVTVIDLPGAHHNILSAENSPTAAHALRSYLML